MELSYIHSRNLVKSDKVKSWVMQIEKDLLLGQVLFTLASVAHYKGPNSVFS